MAVISCIPLKIIQHFSFERFSSHTFFLAGLVATTAVPACGWEPAVNLVMARTCFLWLRLGIKRAGFFQGSFKP